MRRQLVLLLIVVICFGQAVAQKKPQPLEIKPPTAEEKREAEKAWEALVKAKGGRERLHSINNMLTKSKWYLSEQYGPFTRLDVFPNVIWQFNHNRPEKPLKWRNSLFLLDVPQGIAYFANGEGIYHSWRPEKPKQILAWYRLLFLLETKWDKPELLRLTRVFRRGRGYDAIQTTYEGARLDFLYDPEAMLVSEVDTVQPDGKFATTILSDYTVIDGIQMPRTWGMRSEDFNFNRTPAGALESKLYGIEFEFNVDFNPSIFKGQYIRAGSPDDWKAKKPSKKEK
jgi:hypothetical protein